MSDVGASHRPPGFTQEMVAVSQFCRITAPGFRKSTMSRYAWGSVVLYSVSGAVPLLGTARSTDQRDESRTAKRMALPSGVQMGWRMYSPDQTGMACASRRS